MNPSALRGDGLLRAHRALAALEEGPTRLRSSDSPPLYRSPQIYNPTLLPNIIPLSEEQRRCEERKWQLINERWSSYPYKQYEAQTTEERARLEKADRNGTRPQPVNVNFFRLADDIVRKRWEEQGIWSREWSRMVHGRWKHEQPLESEPESDTDTAERRVKSDEEKRQIAERRAKQERDREASRPFHQFVYQLSTERGRIQEESGGGSAVPPSPANINTMAYARVKDAWIKRKIWNYNWGTLPGMTWKHEDPFVVDDAADEPAPVEAENDSYEAGARPGCSWGNPMSVGSDDTNASWQGPPADLVSPKLENPDPERSPLFTDERSNRARSRKHGQTHASDSTSLGPVHQSRVSKAPTSKHPRHRWQPAGIPQRRSQRLRALNGTEVARAQWQDGQSAGGRLD